MLKDKLVMGYVVILFASLAVAALGYWYSRNRGTMNSVEYYNKHTDAFYNRTIHADMSPYYQKFLSLLPPGASILDAGCGVGRDAKYFNEQGYAVTAFDASESMVRLATEELGYPALLLTFNEMTFEQEFDAVWACRSLLHVPYEEMRCAMENIHKALKPGGIFYASYKYGSEKMAAGERTFFNMNEQSIMPYIDGLFEVVEVWKTPDTTSRVSPSLSKAWLSILCRKI